MEIENILQEYRNGDEGKRLSLFLAFRELRDQFVQIEDETARDDFALKWFPWKRKQVLRRAA